MGLSRPGEYDGLKVVWDEHGALLLDLEEAAELSRGGAWSDAAMALVGDATAPGDEEFAIEYGRVHR